MQQQTVKELFSRLFEPKRVAFVGASDTPGKWGFTILLHILQAGYEGELLPINPRRAKVFDLPCYPTLADIDGVPDLAVLVVPGPTLIPVMEEVIAKGIKAAVVITSGFAEAGEEGRVEQDRLVRMTREAGLRFVGPNSMGVYTAFPSRLTAIMSSVIPVPGPVAVLAQSGNLGVSLTGRLMRRGIGISRVVSVGNMADLNMPDYLDLLEDDDKTTIVTAYIEGSEQGKRLFESVERVSRKKPVVMIKGARGVQGMRAAMSHTAALSGGYETFLDAMEEAGAIIADSMDDAVNIIGGLNTHPLPKGRRVGIMTLGGGWGVLGSDAVESFGLSMPDLPARIIDELSRDLPPYWSRGNPIDTVASTNIMMIPKILRMLLEAEEYDSVIYLGAGYLAYQGATYRKGAAAVSPDLAVVGDQLIMAERQMLDILLNNRDKITKPLLFAGDLVARDLAPEDNMVGYLEREGFFVHNAPWQAAQALAALVARKEFLERVDQIREAPAITPDENLLAQARTLVATAQARTNRTLSEHESKSLLALVGVPVPPEREAESVEQALEAATAIGFPVVLKVSNPDILHKSDIGGVVLNVRDEAALRREAERLLAQGKVLVQKQAPQSPVELLVGIKRDAMFGPCIVFGKGGVEANIWNDSASLPTPIRPDQAERLIDRTTVSKLLAPFRGRGALDRAALVDLLVRTSQLPGFFPEIEEMDLNPVFCYETGVLAVDAAIVLSPAR